MTRVLLGAALLCATSHLRGVTAMAAPPQFTLDLDLPPSQRWAGAVALVLAAHPWESSFGVVFAAHNASLFNNVTAEQFDQLTRTLQTHFPETAAEIQGISEQFTAAGHPVSVAYLSAWVYFHELAHTDLAGPGIDTQECTGLIVAAGGGGAGGADAPPVHVANMDQSPEAVRNITLQVHLVQNNGTTVARGVDWYWITTGMSRMVRAGVASTQENWRDTGVLDTAATFTAISNGAVPQILMFRQTLLGVKCSANPCTAADNGFAQFVRANRGVALAAPYYVVAAGPAAGNGVVMARSAAAVDSELNLGEDGQWYLAQTNYDQCAVAPAGTNGTTAPCHVLPDSTADPRRTAAVATLVSIGPSVSGTVLGAFAVASTYPVHNPHTAFTAVMSAAAGTLTAFVRTAMCPETAGTTILDSRYCGGTNATTAWTSRG